MYITSATVIICSSALTMLVEPEALPMCDLSSTCTLSVGYVLIETARAEFTSHLVIGYF